VTAALTPLRRDCGLGDYRRCLPPLPHSRSCGALLAALARPTSSEAPAPSAPAAGGQSDRGRDGGRGVTSGAAHGAGGVAGGRDGQQQHRAGGTGSMRADSMRADGQAARGPGHETHPAGPRPPDTHRPEVWLALPACLYSPCIRRVLSHVPLLECLSAVLLLPVALLACGEDLAAGPSRPPWRGPTVWPVARSAVARGARAWGMLLHWAGHGMTCLARRGAAQVWCGPGLARASLGRSMPDVLDLSRSGSAPAHPPVPSIPLATWLCPTGLAGHSTSRKQR
jgi:hypothetical protein